MLYVGIFIFEKFQILNRIELVLRKSKGNVWHKMQRDLTTRDHQSPAINVCWKWYAPRGVCYAARLYGSLRTRGEVTGLVPRRDL